MKQKYILSLVCLSLFNFAIYSALPEKKHGVYLSIENNIPDGPVFSGKVELLFDYLKPGTNKILRLKRTLEPKHKDLTDRVIIGQVNDIFNLKAKLYGMLSGLGAYPYPLNKTLSQAKQLAKSGKINPDKELVSLKLNYTKDGIVAKVEKKPIPSVITGPVYELAEEDILRMPGGKIEEFEILDAIPGAKIRKLKGRKVLPRIVFGLPAGFDRESLDYTYELLKRLWNPENIDFDKETRDKEEIIEESKQFIRMLERKYEALLKEAN